jgi:hypothetical protein
MKMKAQNTTQRYVIFLLCVLNSVTVTPQHMQNFSRPLEMMQCEQHKPFAGTKMFSEGITLAEDEQRSGRPSASRTGDNTARVRVLVLSDRKFKSK